MCIKFVVLLAVISSFAFFNVLIVFFELVEKRAVDFFGFRRLNNLKHVVLKIPKLVDWGRVLCRLAAVCLWRGWVYQD